MKIHRLKSIIRDYDREKGWLRKIFGDHPSIKALKQIVRNCRVDEVDDFKLLQTYLSFAFKRGSASSRAYATITDEMIPPMSFNNWSPLIYVLQSNKMLCKDVFDLIKRVTNSSDFYTIIDWQTFLRNKNLLTVQNLKKVIQKVISCQKENLSALEVLNSLEKIPERILLAIFDHPYPNGLDVTIKNLIGAGLFEDVWSHISDCPDHFVRAECAIGMKKRQALTYQRFLLRSHSNAKALLALVQNDIPTDYWGLATENNAELIVQGLLMLKSSGIFTRENINLLSANCNEILVNYVLRTLNQWTILNQDNFNVLFTPWFAPLLNFRAVQTIWDPHFVAGIDQELFDRIVALARTPIVQNPRRNTPQLNPNCSVDINPNQSTHTASVHKSASKTATNLLLSYHEGIRDENDLEEIIDNIQEFIEALPSSKINNAARRCIERITANDYVYVDPVSQVSIKQLLALSWLAISDSNKRMGKLEDARDLFVYVLYEIQRGDNMNKKHIDKGGSDCFICEAGTFNKLVEKLRGVHPDCELIFMTEETATLKFKEVIKEEMLNYLAQFSKPRTGIEAIHFTQLIKYIKEQGTEVIWSHIKSAVADRMYEEFEPLFTGREDEKFLSMMDSGQYLVVPDLSIFQKNIQESKGYLQYCTHLLQRFTAIFTSDKDLITNRHANAAAQHAYDERFGLTIR